MAIVEATETVYDELHDYDAVYNLPDRDKFTDRQEAMEAAEKWIRENREDLYHDLVQTRGDAYISDREVTALGYVLKSLYMVFF